MTNAALEFLSRKGRAVWSVLLFVAALILLAPLNSEGHFSPAVGELGPRFWPQLWLIIMLLLTALDAALALRKRPAADDDVAAAASERVPESLSLLFAGMALVILYAITTIVAGFALATLIFLVAFSYLGGYRRIPSLLLVASGTTLVLIYIFVYVVYISLPLGLGPFLEMNVALYRLLGIF